MFQPVIPFGGFAGWSFLNRTLPVQQKAFDNDQVVARDVAYFEENIGSITNAKDLVADRTLLKVALGAFGLGDDINNKFFIEKILDDGTLSNDALSNKLSDKRYNKLAKAFGFGDFPIANTQLSDFSEKITAAYKNQQFEVAVGEQNENLRLALGVRREISELAGKNLQEDTKWFTVMGNPPLRKVFETAFNLPQSFATLDLDTQLKTFKEKTQNAFGDSGVSQFSSEDKQEDLIRLFLIRSDAQAFNLATNSSQTALTMLQNMPRPNYSLF